MKSKKILTILLSLAIMFTFMPAMAFAADTTGADNKTVISWGDDFKTASSKDAAGNVTNYNIEYAMEGSDGLIKASAYQMKNGTKVPAGDVWFFDINGATLYASDSAVVAGNYDYNSYKALFGPNLYIKLAKPSYITDAQWATAINAAKPQAELSGTADKHYTVAAKGKADDTATKGESKTITGVVTTSSSMKGTAERPYLTGADLTASVTITDGSDVAADAGWYLDTVSKTTGPIHYAPYHGQKSQAVDPVTYDGKEHTYIYKAPNNETVTYQKLNSRGGWDNVEKITVKNAGEYGKYRVVYRVAGATTDTVLPVDAVNSGCGFIFTVNEAGIYPKFTFKDPQKHSSTDLYDYDLTAEQAADPVKFVELTAKSFIATDEEALMNYFNDFYTVKVVQGAAKPELQDWTIEPKYDASKAADAKTIATLNKKYATLLANYGKATLDENGDFVGQVESFELDSFDEAWVRVQGSSEINTKDDDITFSGVTKKTYKAKKSTKKLAKTKSFTVSAVADSGNAVTFTATSTNSKIKINKTTGKVTVKKGLKKGTYKITVKAKTAAGNGYKACKESKTYTIKVK